jgi:hypothetical protein
VATDLSLVILDPVTGAVVSARWLGGNRTLEAAQEILARAPTTPSRGLECWVSVTPDEVARIAEARYADGGTSAEVALLSERFPIARHAWMIIRDF